MPSYLTRADRIFVGVLTTMGVWITLVVHSGDTVLSFSTGAIVGLMAAKSA